MRGVLTEAQVALADGHPYRRHHKLDVHLVAWALHEYFSHGRTIDQIRQDLESLHGVVVCSRTLSNAIRRRTWTNVWPHATRVFSRRTKLTPDQVINIRYLGGLGLSAGMILDGLQLPVSVACIGRILRREVWKKVAQPATDAISTALFGGVLEGIRVPRSGKPADGHADPSNADSGCSLVAEREAPNLSVVPIGDNRGAARLRDRKGCALVREYDEQGRLQVAHWTRGDGFHRVHVSGRYLRPDCGLGLLVSTYKPEKKQAGEQLQAWPGGLTPVKPPTGKNWQRDLPKHPLDQLIDQYMAIVMLNPTRRDLSFFRPARGTH